MASHTVVWETPRADNMVQYVRAHLDKWASTPHPVAVFDIDETLLINSPEDAVTEGIVDNKPGHVLYNSVRKHKIPVYIVTARKKSEASHDYAVRQLHSLGYTAFERLYLTPTKYCRDDDPSRFKADARARIEAQHGGKIVLCVGDQITDHLAPGQSLDHPVRRDLYCGFVSPSTPECLSVKLPE